MLKPVLMPEIGPDLKNGRPTARRVTVGDRIARGDTVAVVETAALELAVKAPLAGTALDPAHGKGGKVKMLEPLLTIGEPGKTPEAPASAISTSSASAARPARLHRVRLRKGQGDPVVMIHGFGADHNAWRLLVGSAMLSRPILAIDLPGHGRSPGGATSLPAMASAVAATLAEEGVTAADLVGHSLGAAVATAVAKAADFRVRSLFLLSSAGLGPEINGDFLAGFCRARSEANLTPWMAMLVADSASLIPAFIQVTAETRAQPGVAEAQEEIARHIFPNGTQAFSVRKAIESLAAPIRIAFSEADRIIPARHMAGLPDTIVQHLLPGIGHMPQVEARDAVARLLVEHLQSIG